MRLTVCGLMVFGLMSFEKVATAQYSQPILLEVARDPGRADAALTARALALGGARAPAGRAEDALANPAGLVLLTRAVDLVGSVGWLRFGRDELVATPTSLPPRQPLRSPSSRSISSLGYGAVATRHSNWAAAGFYDASARIAHAFSTSQQVLRTDAIPGIISETSGAGRASFQVSTIRIGGTISVGPHDAGAGFGVAVYGVRLAGEVESQIDGVIRTQFYPPYEPSVSSFTWSEDNRVVLSGWDLGIVVSGLMKAGEHVVISGRWQRDPKFAAARRVTRRNSRDTSTSTAAKDLEFGLPSVIGASAAITIGAMNVISELTFTGYSSVFGPEPTSNSLSSFCERQEVTSCEGWGFHDYRLRDSIGVRTGVEQGVRAGRRLLLIRGGFAFDRAYTAARPATKAFGSGPIPPIATAFTPPRENPWFWSVGGGYRASVMEVGAGCAFGRQQDRCLADVTARF